MPSSGAIFICLHLKTTICPQSTTILGWVWTQGQLSASQHRVDTLSSGPPPDTVRGLRSFIGAYKALSHVLPYCSQLLAPLDQIISGKESCDTILWTDTSLVHFHAAQNALREHKSIALPRPSDQLWIVTDGSVAKSGIGATLYVNRDSKVQLAGSFSAKLRKHQVTWLPCEIEALSIAASIKHFSPYIIQSVQPKCLLTEHQAMCTGSSKIVSWRIFCQPSGNILSFHRQSLCRSRSTPCWVV